MPRGLFDVGDLVRVTFTVRVTHVEDDDTLEVEDILTGFGMTVHPNEDVLVKVH